MLTFGFPYKFPTGANLTEQIRQVLEVIEQLNHQLTIGHSGLYVIL